MRHSSAQCVVDVLFGGIIPNTLMLLLTSLPRLRGSYEGKSVRLLQDSDSIPCNSAKQNKYLESICGKTSDRLIRTDLHAYANLLKPV